MDNAQKPRDFISSLDTQDGDRSPRFEVKKWWFNIFPHELQIADKAQLTRIYLKYMYQMFVSPSIALFRPENVPKLSNS